VLGPAIGCYVFATTLADGGDFLAALQGSDCLFVLRHFSGNPYTFLGPALCYAKFDLDMEEYYGPEEGDIDESLASDATAEALPDTYYIWVSTVNVDLESLPLEEILLVSTDVGRHRLSSLVLVCHSTPN